MDLLCDDTCRCGKNMIIMPRGDVRPIRFKVLNTDGDRITFELDEVLFTVKKYFTDRDYKFQKKLSDGSIYFGEDGYYHFTIEESDTSKLSYGDYVFDIEIFKYNSVSPNIKETTIGQLILTDEASF